MPDYVIRIVYRAEYEVCLYDVDSDADALAQAQAMSLRTARSVYAQDTQETTESVTIIRREE